MDDGDDGPGGHRQIRDRMHVAYLGVVAEKDTIRFVHDASNSVRVNHRIKVRDLIRCPGAGELKYLMPERRENQQRSCTVLGDIRVLAEQVGCRSRSHACALHLQCGLGPGDLALC